MVMISDRIFSFFLAVLGLCCCDRAFSSCGKWGLLSSCIVWAPHYSGFSCCRAQASELWHTDLVAPQHVGSFRTSDGTHVPCIGSQIINNWTTSQGPECIFKTLFDSME